MLRSFAFERLPAASARRGGLDETILLMRRGLRIESFDFEIGGFVHQLVERVRKAGGKSKDHQPTQLHPVLAAGAPKVFLSYASEDEERVEALSAALGKAGFETWFDKDGLRGGDRWDEEIPRALNESDYVVVVQSAALDKKVFSYVNKEIALACERQKLARRGIRFIIPVRIDDSPLLEDLEEIQSIDLRGSNGVQELISAIVRDLGRRRRHGL